jgi:hypothetical protein
MTGRHILVHGHCQVELLDSGCCAMAGPFGYTTIASDQRSFQ